MPRDAAGWAERVTRDAPAGTRYSFRIDGELLVTPAPSHRHQRIIFRLAQLLAPYLAEHRIGEIFLGPAELPLVMGERYEPDLFVIPLVDGRRDQGIRGAMADRNETAARLRAVALHGPATIRRASNDLDRRVGGHHPSGAAKDWAQACGPAAP